MKRHLNNLMALWLVVFSLTAVSCIAHIHGNGKVVKQERNVSGFDQIAVSTGIEAILTQDNFEKVVVEVDENIQEILKTEVKDGKLKIYLEEGVSHTKTMKVHVTLKQLKSLSASSGSEVKTENKINAEDLTIHSSSGSEVTMEVNCSMVHVDSS
ncbi:MAG TPA: DUF2807 domain-containing protein, partial [Prolixibacteraceae bacterium]|nr:DUF2807 domain-containing protein [Prolixibacteraceae bacterium]